MTMSVEARQRALEAARAALRQRDHTVLSDALTRLPTTGTKALELRRAISERLAELKGGEASVGSSRSHRAPTPSRDQVAVAVSGGFKLKFALLRLDSSALFVVRPKGDEALIQLNLEHPLLGQVLAIGIDEGSGTGCIPPTALHDPYRILIIALARLELDAPSELHRQRTRQIYEDLGRLLRDFE
jgi:hypothetical protein